MKPASMSSKSSDDRSLISLFELSRRGLARMQGAVAIMAALMLTCALGASAQAPALEQGWYQQSPAINPGPRFESSLTYDAAHGQVVLFSGDDEPADTWVWNGINWSNVTPANNPSARYNPAMVYDAAHGNVVLFGGTDDSSNRLNDTWVWNGSTWTNVTPANSSNSPGARNGSVMVYDAALGEVVLFGGTNGTYLGDTWVWNGSIWTEVGTTGPSPRDDFGMAYDAAHGEVVLFGGVDSTGNRNDTWLWNGTWTQASPSTIPPARNAQGMAYNAALGETLMFGGENPGYLDDTWVWNGTNWTEAATPSGLSARIAPNDMTYDAALGQVILYSGLSPDTDTWEWGLPANFGNVNVCQSGAPAPCSNTLTLNYAISTATTFGTAAVVTQGAQGLDFSLASGGSCAGSVIADSTCTVNVTFTPTAPGLRQGAVELFDSSNTLLATTLIYGVGQAPAAAFGPTVTFTPPLTPGSEIFSSSQVTQPPNLANPLTTDAAGNLYQVNDTTLQKLAPPYTGSPTTVATGFTTPVAGAIDGAGNLYVADSSYQTYGAVFKLSPGCNTVPSSCATIVYQNVPGAPYGVAVDGLGDVFIADSPLGVFEIPSGCTYPGCQIQVGSGWATPKSLAVDAGGDLFVADPGIPAVREIPAGGGAPVQVGSGWVDPLSVAVDAAGDVIVADFALTIDGQDDAGGVVEVPAGCTTPSCQILLLTAGAPDPYAATVSALGQLFVATDGPFFEIDQSQPPQVSFGPVNDGQNAVQTVTLQNIGNQALNSESSPGVNVTGPYFLTYTSVGGPIPYCTAGSSFTLQAGQVCDVGIIFEPTSPGPQISTAVITDNALNGAPATQTIGLVGTGVAPVNYTLTVTALGSGSGAVTDNAEALNCTITNGTVSGTCSLGYTSGSNVTLTATANASTFLGWGGACASAGTNATCSVTMSQSQNVTAEFVQGDFGSVNVCVGGNTSGCTGSTIPVTFNFTAASTPVSQILAFTQGAQGLDFSTPNSGTCIGTFTSGQSCTVNVTFTPTAPGLRMGAVELLGDTGDLLATQLVYGVGQGPEIAFNPGTQTTEPLTNPNYPVGVALDGAGNLYIANYGVAGNPGNPGYVVKITPGGVETTVLSAYTFAPAQTPSPIGVAVDGAGNLYIADLYLPYAVKLTPSGVQTTVGSGLGGYTTGIALDAMGDVFIADQSNHQVVEVTPAGVQTTVPFTGLKLPWGVAVDAAGDVFVADGDELATPAIPSRVVEYSSSGVQSTVPVSGLSRAYHLAVDAAGDLFIADFGHGEVVEYSAAGVQTTVGTGLGGPSGVTVDGSGDLFIGDQGNQTVYEVKRSLPELWNFGSVNVDGRSNDVGYSIQNVGNQNLTGSVGAASNANFGVDLINSTCTSVNGISLTPGATCVLGIYAQPTVSGLVSGTVPVSDNSLNGSPATQAIPVEATGLGSGVSYTLTVTDIGSGSGTVTSGDGLIGCIDTNGVVTGSPSCSANYSSGTVTLTATASAGSAFLGWGGACASYGMGAQCAVAMIAAKSASASFALSNVVVPNVVGSTQTAATTALTGSGLLLGTVTFQYSDTVLSGSVISESPAAGTMVSGGTSINLIVSAGTPPASDQLTLENNYFVTGDYATGGVTLHGTGTGTIMIPDSTTNPDTQGVPDGADIRVAYLYWTTVESTSTPSGMNGTFLGYPITGLQVGADQPNYNDGTYTGILRVYRADVNTYLPIMAGSMNGVRVGSGSFPVTLPNGGTSGLPVTEGASLVEIYRVLSKNFPLKSVLLYNGSVIPTSTTGPIPQAMQGFYDAVGGAGGMGEVTNLFTAGGSWTDSESSQTLGQSNEYIDSLGIGNAYAVAIVSTPVNNSDGDGILDAWKANQGYTDVKTGAFVALPGAVHGHQDLFVQFDYMCSALLEDGTCDFTQPNQYPSPDAQGNDPMAMVTQSFLNSGVYLHLKPGNAILESTYTCTDSATVLCEFPSTTTAPQPGVVAWNGGVELSKIWPANFNACTANPSITSCATRFPLGQKDSYHYVLFGYSLAIPAWNSWFGSLTNITVSSGSTSLVTTGLGGSCPTRVTISGVLGNPNLNGVYATNGCDSGFTTIYLTTPSTVPNWTYPNTTLPEPTIGVTSGTVSSISGYSDVGGSDSVVSLGLWAQDTSQDMSKPATVIAGTLFHELGHTLGLTHGGLYYDSFKATGSYVPTYEVNCKPNYQSTMNYLFQLDGVGSVGTIAYSGQTLEDQNQNPLTFASLGNVTSLTDISDVNAVIGSSSWYVPYNPATTTASPATMHCDGTPLNNANDLAVRVNGTVDPLSPTWSDSENITFDGPSYTTLRGYDDLTNLDLRQVGATSNRFASLANLTSYSNSGVTIGGGGGVTIGGGGGVTIGGGGGVTIGGGGGVTIGGGGGLTIGGGGGVTIGGGGGLTIGGGGGVTIGGGGGATTELDYLTANSIVRPPSSPGMTPTPAGVVPAGIIITWNPPAFGVVETYTIYRSVNGAPAVAVGSVSGVDGNPPGTTWTDFNPATGTVVYTITTTLFPVPIDPTSRESQPSVPAVMKSEQSISLSLPGSVSISNSPATITATAETNGSANGLQVNFVATGSCSIASQSIASGVSSASLNLNSMGTCNITASQSGSSTFDAASSVSGSFQIQSSGSNAQTINLSQLQGVQYGSGFMVSATSSSRAGVTFAASGPCTVSAATGTATGTTTGAGKCTITATAPASGNYGTATAVESFPIYQAVLTVQAVSPTIAYGQPIPALTYTLTGYVGNDATANPPAVSGTPSLSTAATTGSAPGTYPITVSTGTLAAANYSFLYVPGRLTITTGPFITVSPSNINFGSVNLDSITTKTVTVSNTGSAAATISTPLISLLKAGNSDEFVVVNLCPSSLAAGKSCTITVSFVAGAYYNTPQTATLEIMDNAPGSPQPVALSATILEPQKITFTSVPSSAAYSSSFTAAATGGGSGNPITFTASGACSVPPGSATYTMTSGTGTCSVIANQAGNSIYAAAAQVTKTVTATLAAQTITLTNPPTSAGYKSSFTAMASTSSGLMVTFTSSGACSNSGPIYTMTSATGTCSVIANQGGNSDYSAAPKVTKTVSATVAAQTITFTTNAPSSAGYKTSFTVAATASSGLAVTFSSSGACSNSGATYTMTSSTGTCSVIVSQAGNSDYSAAPKVTESVTATLAAQAITFTTNPPATAVYKTSFKVAATGGASGIAVIFTSSGLCSNSGATYTMTSGTGTCSVIANQAGNSNYAAAPQVTKTVTAIQ
jgi:hypothetical protein